MKLSKYIKRTLLIAGILVGVLIVAFILHILLIVMAMVIGPGKDDVVVFSGNYRISEEQGRYDLHKDTGEIILPFVKAYLIGDEESYVKNNTEFIVINKRDGSYRKKPLTDLTDPEKKLIEKMMDIQSIPRSNKDSEHN